MCDAVLVGHTPTGQPQHVDLFIAPAGMSGGSHHAAAAPDPDERALLTFRFHQPPTLDGSTTAIDATRLPPHRRLYLDFEGEMSGGRGTIRRLATGRAAVLGDRDAGEHLHMVLELLDRRALINASRIGDADDERDDSTPPLGAWRLSVVDTQPLDRVDTRCPGSCRTGSPPADQRAAAPASQPADRAEAR